jgi:hypothetical protein
MRKLLLIVALAASGCDAYDYGSDRGDYQLYRSRPYMPPSSFLQRDRDGPFDSSLGRGQKGEPETPDLFDAYTTFRP